MEVDYSKCSTDELLDIERNIDQSLAPDRYRLLREELDKRSEEIQLSEEKDLKNYEKKTYGRLTLLGWFQIAGGLIMCTLLFIGEDNILTNSGVTILLSAFSVLSGILLLKDHLLGYVFSLINQGLQVFSLATTSMYINYSSIGGVYINLAGDHKLGFTAKFDPGFFAYFGKVNTAGFLSVDLLAIFFIYVIFSGMALAKGKNA